MAAGVLLLFAVAGRVCDAAALEVVQSEALLLGDDAVLDRPGDEALPGAVQAALLQLPAVGRHDNEAALGQRWNRVGLAGPCTTAVRLGAHGHP